MSRVVIVGGGIAGLVSALVLKDRHEVVLVEREPECGGLMRSVKRARGLAFDMGTHVIGETGNAVVDTLLFSRLREPDWKRFKVLRTGSHFNGKLYDKSPHVDARCLPPALYEKAVREVLHPEPPASEPRTVADRLRRDFGPTLTEHVHRPAMRKIFACELEELLADNRFALNRFVMFDAARSRELKASDPRLGEALAYTTYDEGLPAVDSCYPRRGGVGQWAESVCRELTTAGVRLAVGRSVAKVEHAAGNPTAVVLDDGERLPCDRLFWGVPPAFLLKAMGVPVQSVPLTARPMTLFHLVFDKPFTCDNYYVTSYDPAYKTFRVTLYPNLQDGPTDGVWHCTAEVIGPGIGPADGPAVARELAEMGIADPSAQLLFCDVDAIPTGFPTLTQTFLDSAQKQMALVAEHAPGVDVIGRHKHDSFSIQSVALEAHAKALRRL